MSNKLLLHQFLSKTGRFASKQELVDAVHDGKVSVDGQPITDTHFQFNPNTHEVTYRGESLTQVEKIYIVMNKPAGYVCARFNKPEADPNKKSVFELLRKLNLSPRVEQSVFTVGRLDEDTTGLLLLTNDGDFCNKIINAEARIPKVYLALLLNPLSDAQHRQLKDGVTIDLEENGVIEKYLTRPAKIEVSADDRRRILITIDEGKKRQIRRMIGAIGNEVIELERVQIGDLTAQSLRLKRGECQRADKSIIHEILGVL